MEAASKAASNNTVINVLMAAAFGGLSIRSWNQQREMEALETEKDSLLKSNKSIKQTLWDWKQQLYAEASSSAAPPLVPLERLKSIYGDVPSAPSAEDSDKKGGKAPVAKIVI